MPLDIFITILAFISNTVFSLNHNKNCIIDNEVCSCSLNRFNFLISCKMEILNETALPKLNLILNVQMYTYEIVLSNKWYRKVDDCFGNLNISKLELINNQIEEFKEDSLINVNGLKKLLLRSNLISKFKMYTLNNLEELDMGNNILEKIDNETLSCCRNLLIIDLSGNKINFIALNAFQALTKLKVLVLSNNKINH